MQKLQYNQTNVMNIKDSSVGAEMLDKLSRLAPDRRITPLPMNDYIEYPHRGLYTSYNLLIGDCFFMIPPEFIMVTSQSTTGQVVTLRQENTQKEKHGHHRKTILVDLVFSDIQQINGYKVPAPWHYVNNDDMSNVYYVDGLRQLLAQFKCAPFLPVTNVLLNMTYGIYAVALQSITISTVKGFPDVLKAQLTLQDVDMFPYLGVPTICYKDMIDWDLFRFYYQRFTTETHQYKRLQSMPVSKDKTHFKMSILNSDVFSSENIDILSICTDEKIVIDGATSNYVEFINSATDDVVVEEFECGYSNILTMIQMSYMSCPTIQFLGGMDTIYNITFRTNNLNVIQALQQLQTTNDLMIRTNPEIQGSLGFVKLESELVEFTGSLFVMIDSVNTSTVPGFPGTYNVQINCVSYDIVQSEREDLNGFRPFDDYLNTGTGVDQSKGTYSKETIYNTVNGIVTKIKQDLYAERKLADMELYPDLRLPTYNETNVAIANINAFRKANGLSELSYEHYPASPGSTYLGQLPYTDYTCYWTSDLGDLSYHGYVDPDFYVFYPVDNSSMNQVAEGSALVAKRKQSTRTVQTQTFQSATNTYRQSYNEDLSVEPKKYDNASMYSTTQAEVDDLIETAEKLARSKLGCPYVWGATGPNSFDCSGFCSWVFSHAGVIPSGTVFRCSHANSKSSWLDQSSYFVEIDYDDRKKGDLLLTHKDGSDNPNHVRMYLGGDTVIHCTKTSSETGVVISKESNYKRSRIYKGKVWRAKKFIVRNVNANAETTSEDTRDLAESGAESAQNAASSVETTNTETTTTSNTNTSENKKLTTYEFDLICSCVKNMSLGGSVELQEAFAQIIFDRLNSGRYGNLTQIIETLGGRYDGEVDDEVKNSVTEVFLNGKKAFKNIVVRWIEPGQDEPASDEFSYNKNYVKLEPVINTCTFYGLNDESDTTPFVIDDSATTQAENSQIRTEQLNIKTETATADVSPITNEQVKKFGSSLMVNIDKATKRSNSSWSKNVNTPDNQYYTSFHDQYKYSKRFTLAKAFPTYMLCILDDDGQWYDGRKLWTNYYTHRSVVDIQVHAAYDMPVETATITITNSLHNLDRTDFGVRDYNIYNDKEIFSDSWLGDVKKWIYKHTGVTFGFTGPKLTSTMIQLHQIIYTHAKLREGARVHLRIGYGSDPTCLATVMNGVVTECSVGDQISMVVSSDGSELIAEVVDAKGSESNNGWLGLFGLGEEQESSNIIAATFCKRQSWMSNIYNKWYESSAYCIEHYGIMMTQSAFKAYESTNSAETNGANNMTGAGIVGGMLGAGAVAIASGVGFLPGVALMIVGGILGAIVGLVGSTVSQDDASDEVAGLGDTRLKLSDLWDKFAEQFDVLPNIYKANYDGDLYVNDGFLDIDSEDNIVFSSFNMTPWDVCQICTHNVPEYIFKSSYYQFDNRAFFGLPYFLERFRYNYALNSKGQYCLFQEAKASSQVHFIDSMENLIDNQVRVSGKSTYTNVRVMYSLGNEPATTPTICSDDSIDRSRQKTKLIDSCITQDALGWDKVWEFFGIYKIGKESARRTGISELIYGWERQYQGQLICFGQPGVKPHDTLLLNDQYTNMLGICKVREVVHSFSTQTGFTSSITPGMIALSTDQNSGMADYATNYLATLVTFASFSTMRSSMYNEYQLHQAEFALLYQTIQVEDSNIKDADMRRDVRNSIGLASNVVGTLSSIYITRSAVLTIVNLVKAKGGIITALSAGLKAATTTIKGIEISKDAGIISNVLTVLGTAKGGVSAGTKAFLSTAKTALSGVASKVCIVLTVISVLIDQIVEYISNKHTIGLIPLWKDGQPFVTNVKDGKHILIMGNNNAGARDYEATGYNENYNSDN